MDWKDALQDVKNDMIERSEVFEAVRRGYTELANSTDSEILVYFGASSADALKGHVSNIKGILLEQEIQDKLSNNGIESNIFEATNHPDTDLQILDGGNVLTEVQIKATDSQSYINEALAENPDIPIVATSEVATTMGSEEIINSGISNTVIEETVIETINPISIKGFVISAALAALTGGLSF